MYNSEIFLTELKYQAADLGLFVEYKELWNVQGYLYEYYHSINSLNIWFFPPWIPSFLFCFLPYLISSVI